VREQIIRDAVANLGFPTISAHAGSIGHLIKKDQMQKFLQTAQKIAADNGKRRAKRTR
jgi:hypothetical protein